MWRRLASAARPRLVSRIPARQRGFRAVPRRLCLGASECSALRGRHPPGSSRGAATQLGAYLEGAGAVWGDAVETQEVRALACEGGTSWSWRVDLPPERLVVLRRGESVESPPFRFGEDSSARFFFFPKGDQDCSADGMCSMWLVSTGEALGPFTLLVGDVERANGASEFCALEDVLRDGGVEVSLRIQVAETQPPLPRPSVQQSLQLSGLQSAEWCIFQMSTMRDASSLVTSPPFRFHHVLLGDMYLEMMVGAPHPGFCTLFFRCRVPTMRLRVGLAVGTSFSKSFVALGRSTCEEDIRTSNCLQVNLDAPGVLGPGGELLVQCVLEEVVSLPAALRDMIPRLDERALWPKRL